MVETVVLPRRLSNEQRELVSSARWLVKRIARRLAIQHGFDEEESIGVGELALTEAVFHFDSDASTPFHVFAFLRVRGEILDTLGLARKRARLPVPTATLGPLASDLTERADPFRDSDPDVRNKLRETLASLAASFALSVSGIATEPSVEESALELEKSANLKSALCEARAELSPAHRELIAAHYDEGLPLTELAKRSDTSHRTVRRRHLEALSGLAVAMRTRGVHHL